MAHGPRARKPSVKSMTIGSQSLKLLSSRNSNQSARNERTTANSAEPPTQGNQCLNLCSNAIELNTYQGSTSQLGTTHLHNETSAYSSIADTGDDTEPEDNNETSNSTRDMNLGGTLRRSRLDSAMQHRLMASILESAAAQGCDVESIVGGRPSQASGPTRSVPASSSVPTIASAPSSSVLAAGPSNIPMLVADSTPITQDNVTVRCEGVTVNSMFMSEGTRRVPAVDFALSNETSLNAPPVPTNEISTHKASASGSYSIEAHSVFAGNGAQPSALAGHHQPGSFTPRSRPDSFTSITTGGTFASSVEMDLDRQDISTSQVNTPWLLSRVGIPTNSCGSPTVSIIDPGPSSDFMRGAPSASSEFGLTNTVGLVDHTVCVFGSNASDCNMWNGSPNFSASVLDQSVNALNGRSDDVSSWSERYSSSQAVAYRPSFSNSPINVHSSTHESNLNAKWTTHDRDPFAHTSNFDFSGSGYFNIDRWSSPSDANPADSYNNSSLSVDLASNDVEMELCDPLGGYYGVEEFQISASDVSNGLVIPPFSLKRHASSDQQKIIEKDLSLVPFRQRLAPPPVELSSLDLDPQLDWVQDSSALSSPECPAAAAIFYDNFSMVMPSSFDDSDEKVQYIPFPWFLTTISDETDEIQDNGEQMDGQADEAEDQPHWVQTIGNEETDDQFEWEHLRQLGFYPLSEPSYPFSEDVIRQTDSSLQHIHRQSRDTSCFRPLKKLATAVSSAVHHYIGHRVQCDYP